MTPAGDQDSTRLIQQIETYLATGEGPRAAPEPTRVKRLRRRPRRRIRSRLKALAARPLVRGVIVVVLLAVGLSAARHRPANVGDGSDHASDAVPGPGYSFENVNRSGTPMRWNPCEPIHYKTNLGAAPSTAASDLAQALQTVRNATGINFVDDGPTTIVPTRSWQREATRRRSPVVIAWASASQTDVFANSSLVGAGLASEVGVGGPGAIIDPVTGHGVYVSGLVVIDRDSSARLAPGFGANSVGVVLMHELGHLIGLGHVASSVDIMNPTVERTKTGTWGPGDQAGLARLGIESGCLRVPSRQSVTIY